MALVQEIAGEILRRFGRQPHDRVGAFLDRASGARASHVSANPAGADAVHCELW